MYEYAIDVGNRFLIRVRKFFILYNFRKQISCVGVDYELMLGSGFILLDSLQHPLPLVKRNGGKTVFNGLSDPQFQL